MAKWVYLFSEGNANMRELLGGNHSSGIHSNNRSLHRLLQ